MREKLINHPDKFNLETFCSKQVITDKAVSIPIAKILESNDKCFSIEICPIKDLNRNLLSALDANFCSVTWRNPTADHLRHVEQIPAIILAKQLRCQGYNVLMHVAGRNLRNREAMEVLNSLKNLGVRNLFVLQGDASEILETDDKQCDFPHAVDLVRFIRAKFGDYFCIGVAGYPEKHPAAKSLQEDMYYLKQKVITGADFIITQASYDYKAIKSFCRILRASGITTPVIPGIFIVKSYQSLISISNFCSVPIPPCVLDIASANRDNIAAVKEFGIHHAATLIKNILSDSEGLFAGFHLFSLNDLSAVEQVLEKLGLLKPRIEYPL